jgi:hypothetical protein
MYTLELDFPSCVGFRILWVKQTVSLLTPDRIAIILQAKQQAVCKEENKKITPKTETNSKFDKIINNQQQSENAHKPG